MAELISFDFSREEKNVELVVLINGIELQSTARLKEIDADIGLYMFQWAEELLEVLDQENMHVLNQIAWAIFNGNSIEFPALLNIPPDETN